MAGNGPERAAAGATFGDELRREREIRGISLKEIAEATKVSQRLLEAIEKDDYRYLPAPVFTRGFVREYARYLGLDCDEMVTRYIHFTHTLDVPAVTGQPEPLHSDRITAEIPIPRPYARVDRRIWVFLALLVIFIGALLGFRAWNARRDAAAATSPPAMTEPAPRVEPAPEGAPPETAPVEKPVSADPPQDTTAMPSVLAGSGYDAQAARPFDPDARS
ncbi:MAG TPA: helix-turn-helix domain-containing protein [Thermoanaerobaculia bacterium]|nr:helix-turn-helix domain-containing protein [Thermoanaerobaculia bacterium]